MDEDAAKARLHRDTRSRLRLPSSSNAKHRPASGQDGTCLDESFFHIKCARREIFIEGALTERFKQGVQSLVEAGPTEDQLDAFIATFTETAQQPVVLH